MTNLPKDLEYLRKVMGHLEKTDLEFEGENYDPSKLEEALTRRIRGLSNDSANELLHRDMVLLKNWADFNKNDAAYWVIGFMNNSNFADYLRNRANKFVESRPPITKLIAIEFQGTLPDDWIMKSIKTSIVFIKGRPGPQSSGSGVAIAGMSEWDLSELELYYLQQQELYGEIAINKEAPHLNTKQWRVFIDGTRTIYFAKVNGIGIEAQCQGLDSNKADWEQIILSIHAKSQKKSRLRK